MKVWRYVAGGYTRHQLPDAAAIRAVCGKQPWAEPWLGGGTTLAEEQTLAQFPKCRNCVRLGAS